MKYIWDKQREEVVPVLWPAIINGERYVSAFDIYPLFPGAGMKATRRKGSIVLAKGELTGHAHTLEVGTEEISTVEEFNGDIAAIVLPKPTPLVHQEHATVEIPEGIWLVRRQREFWGQERRVAD